MSSKWQRYRARKAAIAAGEPVPGWAKLRERPKPKAPPAAVELPDPDRRPEAVERWLESELTVPQGRYRGRPFELFDWQRQFLRGMLAPGVSTAALSMGRGGGKTVWSAALGAAALVGPLRQEGGEVLIVASSIRQGSIAFEFALQFLGNRIAGPDWVTVNNSQRCEVRERRPGGAKLSVLGSDPKRLHGRSPSFTIADEGAQWPSGTGGRMVAALRTAAGKQRQSLFLAIGTRPAESGHWFERMLRREHPSHYRQIHAADREADPTDRTAWLAANPGLDRLPDLERAIAAEAAEAAEDPGALASFRALRLNSGEADTVSAVLIGPERWRECETDRLPDRSGPLVLGFDLAHTGQSAAAAYWPSSGRLEAVGMFPAVPGLRERGLRDGVGGEYVRMRERGELLVCPGRVADVRELLQECVERWGFPELVVADFWRRGELLSAVEAAGLTGGRTVWRRQGWKDGGEDVRGFRRAVLTGKVRTAPSLLMRAALRDSRTISDPAGNRKLARRGEGERRARGRDDAAVAAVLAVAAGRRLLRAGRATVRSLGVIRRA